jgi:hypothetical protein
MMEEKKLTDEELKQAFFILRHGSSEGLSEYIKAVLAIESEYDRQKAEIERLTDMLNQYIDGELINAETIGKIISLEKQVDELKNAYNDLLETCRNCDTTQAVKDKAKEILGELDLFFKGTTFRKGYEFKKIDEELKELKKRNGVEVE